MFFRIFVPNLTLFRTYKVQNLHRLSTRFLFFKVNGCALKVGRGPLCPVLQHLTKVAFIVVDSYIIFLQQGAHA